MLHRHLNHQNLTIAAVDDLIARGKRQDWAELRRAALGDREVMDKIFRVCCARAVNPRAQRYRFWRHYVERNLA